MKRIIKLLEARTWMINEHCSYIHIKCSCSLILIDYEFCCKQVFFIELSVFSMALDDAFSMFKYKWLFLILCVWYFPLKVSCCIIGNEKAFGFFLYYIIKTNEFENLICCILGSRRNTNISIWKWNQLFWHCWGLCSWKVS